MKRLVLVLSAVGLFAFCGPGAAQEQRSMDKASPKLMTGRVTHVDARAKSFTVVTRGQSVTFRATKLRTLPAVGAAVDVSYDVTPDGVMEAVSLNSSKSNVN